MISGDETHFDDRLCYLGAYTQGLGLTSGLVPPLSPIRTSAITDWRSLI